MDLLIVFIKLATALAGLAREVLKLIDARREGRERTAKPKHGASRPQMK